MNLSKQVKITQAITPTAGAAATSDINGATLDMAGFEGVLIEVVFGDITAGAVTSIKAQQGAASNLSDAADLAGTGQTVADTDDGDTFYIDLYRPTERYVRVVVDRGTQNAVVASATYFQYGAHDQPVSHGTTVNGELHVSPDEGTA
jgi:hypothetical protein